MASNSRQIEIATELLARAKAKDCFYEFVKQAWPIVEGSRPFVDGWHIKAVCDHTEAMIRGQIRNLLVNQPPRTMKSTSISVMLVAWTWITWPEKKFLYASYAHSLAERDSILCRRLIKSDWYQRRWGDVFKILDDQDKIVKFSNNKAGVRQICSPGGSTTGEGGDYLIADDPNSAGDGQSEATRESTISWWKTTWSSRGNEAKKVCRLVVQQRIHEIDISGYILSHDPNNEWIHLLLPMEFEIARRARTVKLPGTNKVWEDPRQVEGELLWPEQVGPKELQSLKNNLGSEYNIAGQLQQRPSPEGGGIIKKTWFPYWKSSSPPNLELIIQSWDTALESTKANAYSACCTFGIFKDKNGLANIILLSMWRGNVEYPDLRRLAVRLFHDYRDDDMDKPIKPSGHHKVDILLVEAKASGISLIQDLIRAGLSPTRFDPTKHGDKIQRVRTVSHFMENGRVWLPAKPPAYDQLRKFADIFLYELSVFPNGSSRDLVDCLTQVLIRLKLDGWIRHSQDPEYEEYETTYREEPLY